MHPITPAIESIRILLALTLLTGFLYPLSVTGLAHLAFRHTATGSVVRRAGQPVGSMLIAQKTERPAYFHPRPSAGDFATIASAASNKGPTSADLAKAIARRRAALGPDAPDDLVTTSGSGLDPHLSPAAARFQAPRIAAERGIPVDHVNALIDSLTERPQLGFLGEPRVNVLALNLGLDAMR